MEERSKNNHSVFDFFFLINENLRPRKEKCCWKDSCITRQEIRSERNISIVLEVGSRRDRDVTAWLIRAGGKERVCRYHLLFLITLMSLNVFVFIHQLKGYGGQPLKSGYVFFFSLLMFILSKSASSVCRSTLEAPAARLRLRRISTMKATVKHQPETRKNS